MRERWCRVGLYITPSHIRLFGKGKKAGTLQPYVFFQPEGSRSRKWGWEARCAVFGLQAAGRGEPKAERELAGSLVWLAETETGGKYPEWYFFDPRCRQLRGCRWVIMYEFQWNRTT